MAIQIMNCFFSLILSGIFHFACSFSCNNLRLLLLVQPFHDLLIICMLLSSIDRLPSTIYYDHSYIAF